MSYADIARKLNSFADVDMRDTLLGVGTGDDEKDVSAHIKHCMDEHIDLFNRQDEVSRHWLGIDVVEPSRLPTLLPEGYIAVAKELDKIQQIPLKQPTQPQLERRQESIGALYYGANAGSDTQHLLHTDTENISGDEEKTTSILQHFRDVDVLLQLANNSKIFHYLYAHLEGLISDTTKAACANCDSDKFHEHVTQIMRTLGNHAFDPNIEHQVTTILDTFFTDLTGSTVQGADYAFVQLVGPNGPYVNDQVRLGVSYQGPGLSYLGHHHVAQELYVVLGGSSLWWTDSEPQFVFRNVSFHASNAHHAMSTPASEPGLFFWSWTGDVELEIKHSPPDIQEQLVTEQLVTDQ